VNLIASYRRHVTGGILDRPRALYNAIAQEAVFIEGALGDLGSWKIPAGSAGEDHGDRSYRLERYMQFQL